MNTEKTNWVVFGYTNPYHASKYRHITGGKEKWVQAYFFYKTEEEMSAELMDWLCGESDNISHYDDKEVAQMKADGEDVSWYEGEGVYDSLVFQMGKGDMGYSHDIWSYRAIQESELSDDEMSMFNSSNRGL